MANCRSISPETWTQAREALVFYFSRRGLSGDAEDLAQETIKALWSRGDYEFQREEDFLRVCYGFARRVLQQGRRAAKKQGVDELDPSVAAPFSRAGALQGAEVSVYLKEIQRIGAASLEDHEWKLIQEAVSEDYGAFSARFPSADRSRIRVSLYRARKALARLAGRVKHKR